MAFKKADKPGYIAFIPIYNQIVLCDIAGVSRIWVVGLIFGGVIPVLGIAVVLYSKYLISFSVAKSFGKDNLFGFALFFLATVFYYIIGLDSSKYLGPRPVADHLFNTNKLVNENCVYNDVNQVNQSDYLQSNNNYSVNQGPFCVNCGVKLNEGVLYCHNCGKRI